MKKELLFSKFSQALNWNILLYTMYKGCFITVSYLVYNKVSSFYFSQWAMSNALLFLGILWIDPGFKKSIPRFYPLFSQDPTYHKRFIFGVLCTQVIILIGAVLPFLMILPHFITLRTLYPLLSVLFVTEGIGAIFQTLYHAHFKNKQFNSLQIICTLLEMFINIYIIITTSESNELWLIQMILTTKIISSVAIIIGSLYLIPNLYQQKLILPGVLEHPKKTIYEFIIHSCCMWGSTAIKSLTERNFLFPYFTTTFGLISANTFKIAHDSALFFQRISLKALGSADTALLSYIQIKSSYAATDSKEAFRMIVKIVSYLSVSFAFIGVLAFAAQYTKASSDMITIFLIVAIGYMIEIFLSPYERLLEVQRRYKLLWISYTPYIIVISILGILQYYKYTQCSMIQILSIIHGIRIISSLSMAFYARKKV